MSEPLTRVKAQERAEEIRAFTAELQRLDGRVITLTDEQHGSIRAHHEQILDALARQFDIDRDTRSKQLSLGMRVASLLGAIAFAASVFFLFYQFWGLLGTALQVTLLAGASALTFGITVWARKSEVNGYFAKLAAMVAFVCFVLNISMLGQIFNITPSDKALLPWAAYAFVLAYLCDLRLLLVAGLLCIMGFIAARAGEMGGLYWLDFGERPENFFPAALAIFGLPWALNQSQHDGFAQTYRLVGLLALFMPILVLSQWGEISYLSLNPQTIEYGYQILGFLSSAAVIWLGIRARWPGVVNTGVTFFIVFLYTKFYDWWWNWMPKYLFFLVLGLTALLTLVVLRRLRSEPILNVQIETNP